MSYCRFIEADAYIYDDTMLGLYCCACSLSPTEVRYSPLFEKDMPFAVGFSCGYDYDKMLDHIKEHREAGHFIPLDVDERLKFDRDCTHPEVVAGVCKSCWGRPYDTVE